MEPMPDDILKQIVAILDEKMVPSSLPMITRTFFATVSDVLMNCTVNSRTLLSSCPFPACSLSAGPNRGL